MAFTPTPKLYSDPFVTLRDQQHAANMFTVDQFRLAPKHNFLFHVSFGINLSAVKSIDLVQRYGSEINMLVKSADLPNYTVSTEVLNQYNRKKVVQYTHKYGDLGIKFHDDNMGLINQLWQNYYSYYYADSTSAKNPGAYTRNATRKSDFIPTNYGLDNASSSPFFSYIKIYQMARHEYVCYSLQNPVITSWNHNRVDYANAGVHDIDMKIAFESVEYSSGLVDENVPIGFGASHYDSSLSPLSGQPDPNSANPSFSNTSNTQNSAQANTDASVKQINTAQNTKGASNASTGGAASNTTQTTSGPPGYSFPR